jgi:phospholipase C
VGKAKNFGTTAAVALLSVTMVASVTSGAAAQRPARALPVPHLGDLQHIVVLMQENRSYDNYFGALHGQGQPASEAAPPTGNRSSTSTTITPFHQSAACDVADVNHSWTGTHAEINNGKMDGFATQNMVPADPTGRRAFGRYDSSDLPFYYQVANTFGIGDRYFSSVPGPTYPNRFYELAGTSFGHIKNDLPPTGGYTQPTIFGRLQQAGISWAVYDAQFPTASFFSDVQAHMDHLKPISQYYADAAAGTLPQVTFVEPKYIASVNVESDEHPPANLQVGQQFSASIIRALTASPNWSSSALVQTWDEHGGFYDHVAPPAAVKPDAVPPMLGPNDVAAQFDRYGPRVPVLVVSPFSKPHFVSHRVSDHTSILSLIEHRFQLAPLTRRDAQANPMLEYFDFAHPHFRTAPPLPAATVDPARAAQCAALHPSPAGS